MLSWSVAVASRSRENRGKHPRFCQRNTNSLFANTRATFSGRNLFIFKMAVWGGSHAHEMTLLIWNTGSPGCHRPEAKEAVRRPTTKKCGSPLRRSPCLGLSFAGTGFRSFLFPVFEKVIQCHVKGGFHALLHDTHDFLFKNGLLLLLVFLLFLFLTV